jgi:glucosyl-dolichyl phosphate glucuronosyltransferase
MNLSIIIPTHNRADSLKTTLESLVALQGEAQFEIVVVDNNSSDHTKTVVQSFSNFTKYVFEPKTAFTRARHAGSENASGDVLLYLDDDVIVQRGSLRKIVEIFQGYPDCGVIAGKITAQYLETPAPWVFDCQKSFNGLSLFDSETYSIIGNSFQEVPSAAGPMMAIRRLPFDQIGGFPPDTIGVETNTGARSFRKLFIGPGDYGLCLKIQEVGYKVYYSPEISCFHVIPPIRCKLEFWRARMANEGQYVAIADRGFFRHTAVQLFINRIRAHVQYYQWKQKLRSRIALLVATDPQRLQAGMLPEELWVRYYAAYLEMDYVLRRYPDLYRFLWDIGREGVANNDFDYVMSRLPAEYKAVVSSDSVYDSTLINSLASYEKLVAGLNADVRAEHQMCEEIIREIYRTTSTPADQIDLLNIFSVDQGIPQVLPWIEKLSSANPHHIYLLKWLGVLYSKLGKYQKAGELFSKAASAASNDTEALRFLEQSGFLNQPLPTTTTEDLLIYRASKLLIESQVYLQNQRFDEALMKLNEAMIHEPRLPYLQLSRAICLGKLHRKREAIDAAVAELTLQPGQTETLSFIADQMHFSKQEIETQPDSTLRLIDRVLRHSGSQIQGLQKIRALCLIGLARLREALEALKHDIQQDPNSPESRLLLEKVRLAMQSA